MKTEGAIGAGPATIAMIASPLQALNLVEYAEATGNAVDLVLVGDGVSPDKTIPQIREVLSALPGTPIHVRATDGWDKGTPNWQERLFSELLLKVLGLGRPVERLILGDFRITTAFQVARLLRLAPEQITLLDDGLLTLMLDRRPGSRWERLLELPWGNAAVPDNRMPRGVTVFTAYPTALKLAAEDRVLYNDYALTRSRLAELAIDPDLVVVIGSPFTVPGVDMPAEQDLRIALDLLDETRRRFPGCRVVYAPHRRESPLKLATLSTEVEIREFAVPFELAPLELGVVPGAVVGLRSSVMANLPTVLADFPDVKILAFRAPDGLFSAARVQDHNAIYDYLENHTNGRVAMEQLPVDDSWVTREVSWTRHPGTAPTRVPLGEWGRFAAPTQSVFFANLFGTVCADAGAAVLLGEAHRIAWISGRIPNETPVRDLGSLGDEEKIVVCGGGELVDDLASLDRHPDVRVFWDGAGRAAQEQLLERGFRVYAINGDQASWERLHASGESLMLLYAVRKAGAATVTVVTQWGGMLGGQRSHVEMTEALIRQGHMVDTVFPYDRGLGALLHGVGGSVTLVDPLAVWYRRPAERGLPVSDPLRVDDLGPAQPLLVQELRRRRPDVVLTQCALTPQGAVAAAMLGIPHVWYVREFGDIDLGLVLPGPPAEVGAVLAASSATVITNSACVREYFFPGHPEAATVIHPAPVIPGATTMRSSRERRRPDLFTVGVVADIRSGKDQTTMLEAAVALRSRGVPVRVLLYGGGLSDARRSLESAVREREAGELIHFAGFEPSRERMFSSLDAVIVPSTAEAFGRVPFEAAAFDVPIVYADVAGPSEYMRHEVTGLAFPPGDASGLADAIERLAGDQALRENLADAARADLASAQRQQTLARQADAAIRAAALRSPTEEQKAWASRLSAGLAESLGLSV